MALSGEVIQFHWLNIGNGTPESRAVGKIAIVEKEAASIQLLIPPKMLDARPQQITSAPHDAVHRVSFFQKQFAQIGAVLTGDPGNQRDFVGIIHTSRVLLATFVFCFYPRYSSVFLGSKAFIRARP